MTAAGNLKRGEFILYQNDIWQLLKTEFYSPGKGAALMRTKMRSVSSGKAMDYTYKSQEDVETVQVSSIEMQYLYKDAEHAFFMDQHTYEQISIPLDIIGDIIAFFKEGEAMFVYIYNDKPLSIRPPASVKLKIIQAEDAAKGDTVSNAKKEAIVETGAKVLVPLFIKVGETISINPETGEYTGRV
ncbi:MAG: elongation factor P [bacterium]|nr:elongation factor P [bacterium]